MINCFCMIFAPRFSSVLQVACTGKEERLMDCFFPEDFGFDYMYNPPTDRADYYNENWPAPSHALPALAPAENAPPPSNGVQRIGCDSGDAGRLSVICRRFEITGAATVFTQR